MVALVQATSVLSLFKITQADEATLLVSELDASIAVDCDRDQLSCFLDVG